MADENATVPQGSGSEPNSVLQEAPVQQDLPLEKPVEAAPAPKKEETLRETMERAYDKSSRERDENGRFVARDGEPADTTAPQETTDQAPVEAKEQPLAAIPMPKSWSAEASEAWEKIPPNAREIIAKRETESHAKISQQGQEIKAYERAARVLERGRDVFQKYGIDEYEGINQLINANEYLEANPAAAIRDLAEAYGVDLGGARQPQQQMHPDLAAAMNRIGQLEQQIRNTQSHLIGREKSDEETRVAQLTKQVEDFSSQRPYFEELAQDVEDWIKVIKGREPNLSPNELLDKAYTKALHGNEELFAKSQAESKKTEEAKRAQEAAKRAEAAKKAAPLNVRSSPANSSQAKTPQETMREVADRLYR